jgi:putative colanic acid biosynthesis glycosyltransferase WcaI
LPPGSLEQGSSSIRITFITKGFSVRVLVIGINYWPERTSVGPFTTGLCEHLVAQGHEVTVVTAFPYYPEWRVWDSYRGFCHRREVINGVTVHRVAHYVPRKPSSLVRRLAYDISFTVNSFIAALFAGECDVIYCSCPPPTVAFAAYLLGKTKRAPYAIKLTDLASDAAVATGIMKPGLGIRMARAFEAFTYSRAQAVICLCQGFIDRLKERGVKENTLLLIPDWGDTENIRPCKSDSTFRHGNHLSPEKFLVLHTGNMGKKQRLMNIVNSAELTRDEANVLWVLVGQGEERAYLEQEISRRSLPNFRMLPLQPNEALCQMYSSADLLVLNQAAAIEDAVIPSKLLTYMAAGRPIVAAVSEKSEAARQILLAKCGVVVPAENPRALADAVLALQRNSALREELGVNGRAYADANFTKALVLRKYDEFFKKADPEFNSLGRAIRPDATAEELDSANSLTPS